jgi:Ser/Thr protein kinase RdoA (MazF antagonist)
VDEVFGVAVADAFGLGRMSEAPSYVARGAMGEVWRMTTTRGAWAVKVLFAWDPPEAMPADFHIQLTAADAGIRLPRPMPARNGDDAVVRVGESLVRVYEWVDLDAELSPPVDAHVAAEVGWILGTLHGLDLPVTQPVDPWYTAAPDDSTWTALVEQAKGADVAWADNLASEVPVLRALGEFVASAVMGPVTTCHRDFGPDNVLPGVADGTLIVLDWENAGPLPADAEVAYALVQWATQRGTVSGDIARSLLDAYRRTDAPTLELRHSSFNYIAATHANFLKVMVDQALEESRHHEFATRMVTSLLDGQLTQLQVSIDGLVDVLDLPRA